MSLDLLSPAAFFAGLVALAGGLLLLFLLRVRLRRVPVDSLLFFARLGEVQKPRVLPGRPSRWLAYLLALAALAALWTGAGGLSQAGAGPSTAVLLDASGSAAADDAVWAARRQQAAAMLQAGLGPHGAVQAFGDAPGPALAAGAPSAWLDEVTAAAPTGGSGAGLLDALREARARLPGQPGDAIVVLGGPAHLPPEWDGVPIHRLDPGPSIPPLGIAAAFRQEEALALLVVAPAPCRVTLRAGDLPPRSRDVVPSASGTATVLFEVPEAGGEVRVELACGDRQRLWRGELRPRAKPAVLLDGAPPAVARAIAADRALAVAAGGGPAAAVVTTDPRPEEGRPALVLTDETALADRQPACTEDCPLPLSLRDRARPGSALRLQPGELAWVVDLDTGAPLVAAREQPIRTVRAVPWLLEPEGHRDVPVLVLGALRWLLQEPTWQWHDPLVAPRPVPPPPPAEDAGALAARAVHGPLPTALLLLAVCLLLLDAVLYHRGRLP